jgi:hypothetical protein
MHSEIWREVVIVEPLAGSRKLSASRGKGSHAYLSRLTALKMRSLDRMRSADALEKLPHDHLPAIVLHRTRFIHIAR